MTRSQLQGNDRRPRPTATTSISSVAGGRQPIRTNGLRPRYRIKAQLVGVGTTSAANLVVDQFDADAGESSTVLFAPALTRRLLDCCADDTVVGVQLEDGDRYDSAVDGFAPAALQLP